MKKAVIVVAAVAFALGWMVLRHSGTRRADPSALAPDFSLADLSGHPLKLSDYRGKVVVLDFWATWCEPCKEEIPHFIEMQNKYPQQLQVIGLSMDDDERPVRTFYQRHGMNYPVALANPTIAGQYGGILGLPITFVIDRSGHIVARHIGATNVAVIEAEVQKLLNSGT